MEKQIYYAIMNILDGIALSEAPVGMTKMSYILDDLLAFVDGDISDIADANNCGRCETWDDIITELRKQYADGERI